MAVSGRQKCMWISNKSPVGDLLLSGKEKGKRKKAQNMKG